MISKYYSNRLSALFNVCLKKQLILKRIDQVCKGLDIPSLPHFKIKKVLDFSKTFALVWGQ